MKKEEWVFVDVPFYLDFCCQVLPLVRQEQHCAGSSGGWSTCWDDDRPYQKKENLQNRILIFCMSKLHI
jgi:hypothetical protein